MNRLTTAVWEITMGCNMRCKHCGSECKDTLLDELSTDEALKLCDDLKELGLKVITLSGGEPSTRKDWPAIAKRLTSNGIITSMITNGWLIDDNFIKEVKASKLKSVCISIDGLEEVHDYIRKQGSFKRSIKGLRKMQENQIMTSVITSINSINISQLEEMFIIFEQLEVTSWQLQIALPMGNFAQRPEWMIRPQQILDIIDFAYKKIGSKLQIVLADCIGYYSVKDIKVNENFLKDNWSWTGCGAGKHVVGILQNGDIVACTSIRNKELIAGNVRQRSIQQIWEDPSSFAWNRDFDRHNLKGFCKECQYADKCLGGCSNSRYCMNGSVESENKYCAYNVQINKWEEYIESVSTEEEYKELLEKVRHQENKDLYKITQKIGINKFIHN